MSEPVDRTRLPRPGAAPSVRFPSIGAVRLSSGVELRTVEHPGPPVIQWLLLLCHGSAADPATQPGLAALTADLLDEGSERRSALELHRALDRIGARLGVHVGPDTTTLSLMTLTQHAADGLALLGEIATQPRFEPTDFDRVRTLRRNRLRQMRTVPSAVADRAYIEALYPGHPYGHLGIGTDTALAGLTIDDVRQFHAGTYRLETGTLIAAGAFTHERLIQIADAALGDLTGGTGRADGRERVTPGAPAEPSARLVVVDRPGAVQSEIRIGHVAVSRRTPHYHALHVMNMVLGGQFVSRLNRSLREEKGYTYGVRTGFDFRSAPGPFTMHGSVQADATVESVREVLDEMTALGGARPVTSSELDLARASLTKGYTRGFETSGQVARGVMQLVQHDLPADEHDQFVPRVNAVEAADVTMAAATYLRPNQAVVVVVGPAREIENGLEALNLGPAVRSDG